MNGISTRSSACWRTRLKQCMDERGLTQLDFVRALNRQYFTKFHQKDVSRWLNTGNRTSSGEIGFPKYKTMATIADFFGVDVGYLTGETDEKTYAMSHACAFTGLSSSSIAAIQSWIDTPVEQSPGIESADDNSPENDDVSEHSQANGNIRSADNTSTNITKTEDTEHGDDPMHEYRAATINRLLSSPKFPELASKLLTLQEMSSIWNSNPQKFEGILGSLANDNDLPDDLALQLLLGAFYGMASESFSSLLHDAYPMPE